MEETATSAPVCGIELDGVGGRLEVHKVKIFHKKWMIIGETFDQTKGRRIVKMLLLAKRKQSRRLEE